MTEERKELIRTELSKPVKAKKKRKRGVRPSDAKVTVMIPEVKTEEPSKKKKR